MDVQVGELTEHKEKCEARLKEVEDALRKFGEVPDESKAGTDEVEDTRGRSVMPLLAVSKVCSSPHCDCVFTPVVLPGGHKT